MISSEANERHALSQLRPRACAGVAVTCGGAAVLGILGEGHGSLHAVFLHLLNGVLCERVNVPEANVELVRS